MTEKWQIPESTWQDKIDQFLSQLNCPEKPFLKDSITTLLKVVRDVPTAHDLDLISKSLKEHEKCFKTFGPYRDTRKVAIFGTARSDETHKNYQMAENLAQAVVKKGYMVITGAGPGVMEAGNKGAAPNMGFGLNIRLPFEQSANPYILNSPKLIDFYYFFNRKVAFIRESDATIVFPGGFGTHDECFETLTLIQTGRCSPRPMILMSDPNSNYWDRWDKFIHKELLDKNYISKEDMHLYTVCKNVDEAVEKIQNFYTIFHSVDYHQDITVMHVNKPVSTETIKRLNQNFSDILIDGTFIFQTTDQLDPRHSIGKDAIVFKFNMHNYGRLTQLIWQLNQ